MQEQIPNHPGAAWVKSPGGERPGKRCNRGLHQVRTRKTSVSEPPLKCRKRRDVIESRLQSLVCDKVWELPVYCPNGDRHERWREPGLGFCAERGNLSPRCKGRTSSGRPTRGRVPMRGTGADRLVVVMRPCNGGGAKGSDRSALIVGQPAMGGARE